MRRVPVRVTRRIPLPPEQLFERFAPIELSTIIKRWGPLPGVKGVRDQTGEWDRPGVSRTVLLDDGSTAKEELVAYNPPHHFGYKLTFGAPTSALASDAAGTWFFHPAGDGGTELEWAWAFRPRPGTGLLVELVLGPLWRRYAEQTLANVAAEFR